MKLVKIEKYLEESSLIATFLCISVGSSALVVYSMVQQ